MSEWTTFGKSMVEIKRRAFQRSLNVIVKPSGRICVTANRTTSVRRIYRFLREHQEWLDGVLVEYERLRSRYPRKQFCSKERSFLYLGRNRILNYRSSPRKRVFFSVEGSCLNAWVPEVEWLDSHSWGQPQPHMKRPLLKFYESQGRKLLAERLQHWSQRMELSPKKVSYRSQKTRWGSCSIEGHISLNWRLVAAPMEKLEYVIIHELAHLMHHNHSKSFWRLVERHCPDHREHRRWLRDRMHDFDFLAKRSELYEEDEDPEQPRVVQGQRLFPSIY